MNTDYFEVVNRRVASIPSGMCMNIESYEINQAAKVMISSRVFEYVRNEDIDTLLCFLEGHHEVSISVIGMFEEMLYKVCRR